MSKGVPYVTGMPEHVENIELPVGPGIVDPADMVASLDEGLGCLSQLNLQPSSAEELRHTTKDGHTNAWNIVGH